MMERERWPPLYHAIKEVDKDFAQKYVSHQPWVLVAVLLWAAGHDLTVRAETTVAQRLFS